MDHLQHLRHLLSGVVLDIDPGGEGAVPTSAEDQKIDRTIAVHRIQGPAKLPQHGEVQDIKRRTS
jgi:hypothetical protein